jgi:hypothetical protein
LLDSARNLFLRRLLCRSVFALLCALDALSVRLLGLLPLLVCLLGGCFPCLLLFRLTCLLSTKLLAPLLLLLGLDLRKEVTGSTDLMAYW